MTNNLKSILASRDVTQAELCRQTGLDPVTVNRLANNKRTGTVIGWYRIITALNVDWPDMFPDFYGMEEIDDGEESESEVQAD